MEVPKNTAYRKIGLNISNVFRINIYKKGRLQKIREKQLEKAK